MAYACFKGDHTLCIGKCKCFEANKDTNKDEAEFSNSPRSWMRPC